MAKTCMEGETSMGPVVGIFAPFANNLVTRLAGIEDEGSRSIHRSCFFLMKLFDMFVNVTLHMYTFFHILSMLHSM
jgi:hypothetical protein